jgi:hypothetical protein
MAAFAANEIDKGYFHLLEERIVYNLALAAA